MQSIFYPSRRSGLGLAATMLAALALSGGAAQARTLEVGPDQIYKQPSQAVAAASNGDRIVIAPGEYFDCAIIKQNDLVIEGSDPSGKAVMTDKSCQGKAILVTTGTGITVRNLTLTRARVPDANGAGIRAEGANLLVDRVHFINNQNGILAAPSPTSTIIVRDSEFLQNGTCMKACSHGIYVNNLALLRVERSRFFETKEAHHIKSRAARTEIIGNDIQDGDKGTSSYLIDISNGGSVIIRDNVLEKGPMSPNHTTAIMIGAEGVTQPTREIIVENNQFRNDGSYSTLLVKNLTATPAKLDGNKISGKVKLLEGD